MSSADNSVMGDDAHASGSSSQSRSQNARFLALVVGCIGVVYGDIGTSPLYAFREAVHQVASGGVTAPEVYGILSMIIWALMFVVTIKYILFLLRADNRGEGGILSLMALVRKKGEGNTGWIFFAGVLGCALFYGDAAITPAISVLSAIEGLHLVTPALDKIVLPLSMLILFLLFCAQKAGTGKVSLLFGPITALWFAALAASGLYWIVQNPAILQAFSPHYAAVFMVEHGWLSFAVLGAVFLAVTGAEALYADMGHFGRKPIQVAWVFFVFPALVLNYLGQGALILARPEAIENPFYLMVPDWALVPMVVLATAATIIAGQAVITGAYSLTRQAIQLGFLPRMEIRHTSAHQEGQIYMPKVSAGLLIAVMLLCATFHTSSALAAAYGIAVIGTMIVSTLLSIMLIVRVWGRSMAFALVVTLPFIVIELIFLAANMMKVFQGGIVPLAFAVFVVLLMATWVRGTAYLTMRARRQSISTADLIEILDRDPPHIVEGTAIFLTSDPKTVPVAFTQNLKHNQVMHRRNVIMTIVGAPVPKLEDSQRIQMEPLSSTMVRMVVSYGFMEKPDVIAALDYARRYGFDVDHENATFFLGRRKIVSDPFRGLPGWQDKLYILLSKMGTEATDFYNIPRTQVVEMGVQVAV